jgi:hypothetical protein
VCSKRPSFSLSLCYRYLLFPHWQFRVAIRELGRAEGLELYEHELKKLFHEVESEQGIEVSELRYLTRRALQTIPKPDPYFKSFWNRVDFLTIVIQLLAIIAQATDSTYRRAGTDRTAAQEVREKEPSCPITEPHMLVEGGLRTLAGQLRSNACRVACRCTRGAQIV